jgi:Zn-dependent metalloprotease
MTTNIFLIFLTITTAIAQSNVFKNAVIKIDHSEGTPAEIRINAKGERISLNLFLNSYHKEFLLSKDHTFRTLSVFRDEYGQVHHRISQSYKGIEIPELQMLVHEKDGSVAHAHGKFIHDLDIDVIPSQSEDQALQSALKYVNAKKYMWENHKNESFIRQITGDTEASFYPKGRLIITSGSKNMISENFKLAYRFDIHTQEPYGGYYVDVDATNGEIVNVLPFIYSGDVQGEGLSLYNEMVNITVSDTTPQYMTPPKWHLCSWNPLGDDGFSWRLADSTIGTVGGYANWWYEVLDTDELTLSGDNCRLLYYQRYHVEPYLPTDEYDGRDGFNVRISIDGGLTWDVLQDPDPAYSCTNLLSFGKTFGEGPGIPGWSGPNKQWQKVSFDLSAYTGQTVKIRFAFASDESHSTIENIPALFGWQIDSILITNTQDTLFNNSGEAQGLTARNIARDVNIINEGKYRLREESRGKGIATYDMQNQSEYHLAQDFVDEDSSFTGIYSHAGVSVHWASEVFYDYYLEKHNRNSYDDRNGRIVSFAHYDSGYVNAFWNGYLNIASYGDGNLNDMSLVSLDIVSHELTHGVTQNASGLIYQNESGALKESFSDIFGTMVEFYVEKDNGDWLIGEDCWPGGFGLRSLENPVSLGYPDTYKGINWFPQPGNPINENDWGGVHTNSSVQNYWFYLLSEGGYGTNDNGFVYDITGIGKDAAAQIAYRNLNVYLMPTSQFANARWGSIHAAIDIYGHDSSQLRAVVDAWDAVGVAYPKLEPVINAFMYTVNFVAEAVVGIDSTLLEIYNFGLDTLIISDIQIRGNEFKLSSDVNFPLILPGYEENIGIEILFTPTSEGVKTDSLILYSNDPKQPEYTIYLHGKGWVVHPAQENTMYSVRYYSGLLIKFDGTTEQWQGIGSNEKREIDDICLNPLNNILFGIRSSAIFRIDADSGTVYNSGINQIRPPIKRLGAIAFDINGDLHAANTKTGDLYLINPETGEALLKGRSEFDWFLLKSLAINPLNGDLWAAAEIEGNTWADNRPAIYKINKSNAATTLVGEIELFLLSIAFDAGGRLYGLSQYEASLYRIDTLDFSCTLICETGYRSISGLAINGVLVTDIAEELSFSLPQEFGLEHNYPNPFNPNTMINYQFPITSNVELSVYNLLGQKVVTLINEQQRAGYHQVKWDASEFASGIYYYRIRAGAFQDVKKMILLR